MILNCFKAWSLIPVFFLSFQLFAWNIQALDLNNLGEQLMGEKHEISGHWREHKSWKGTFLCDGSWAWQSSLAALLNSVVFDLMEDGSLDIKAHFSKLNGWVSGEYQSENTFCIPVSGWLGVSVDTLFTRAHLTFIEQNNGTTTLKVKVNRTSFGRIHIGRYVPKWFEDLLTSAVNSAFSYIWETSLGEWLSEKLSETLNNRLPR